MRKLWNSLNICGTPVCKEDGETLKILSAVFLHSSRIFPVVIFTNYKKLGHKKDGDWVSYARHSQFLWWFPKRKDNKIPCGIYIGTKTVTPCFPVFSTRMLSLNYFNIKQRTLLLTCDAGSVTHRTCTDNDFEKNPDIRPSISFRTIKKLATSYQRTRQKSLWVCVPQPPSIVCASRKRSRGKNQPNKTTKPVGWYSNQDYLYVT